MALKARFIVSWWSPGCLSAVFHSQFARRGRTVVSKVIDPRVEGEAALERQLPRLTALGERLLLRVVAAMVFLVGIGCLVSGRVAVSESQTIFAVLLMTLASILIAVIAQQPRTWQVVSLAFALWVISVLCPLNDELGVAGPLALVFSFLIVHFHFGFQAALVPVAAYLVLATLATLALGADLWLIQTEVEYALVTCAIAFAALLNGIGRLAANVESATRARYVETLRGKELFNRDLVVAVQHLRQAITPVYVLSAPEPRGQPAKEELLQAVAEVDSARASLRQLGLREVGARAVREIKTLTAFAWELSQALAASAGERSPTLHLAGNVRTAGPLWFDTGRARQSILDLLRSPLVLDSHAEVSAVLSAHASPSRKSCRVVVDVDVQFSVDMEEQLEGLYQLECELLDGPQPARMAWLSVWSSLEYLRTVAPVLDATLWATRVSDRLLRVSLSFSAVAVPTEAMAWSSGAATERSLSAQHVLLIEADGISRHALQDLLEQDFGASVIAASDMDEAFERISGAVPPNLIIADLIDPIVGADHPLLQAAATLPNAPPVIIITSSEHQRFFTQALEAGVRAVVPKPLTGDGLRYVLTFMSPAATSSSAILERDVDEG